MLENGRSLILLAQPVTGEAIDSAERRNHMSPLRRNLFAGEFLLPVYRRLLAAAGLAFLFTSTAALAQGGPPAMPVTVAPPIAKRVTQWDEYSGRFEAVASVEVRARVSGFIEKLHFKDGQIVNVGDPLFTIDKRPFEIAVDSADAEVARNKAQVNLAELQVQRGASLISSRTITDQEYDQRKANLKVAQAQLKAAEAGLRSAELNLDWTDVRAPVAGRISDRKVDAGNLIPGGQTGATLLATIVTLDPIHFVFDVSEADYSALHAALPVGRAGLVARFGESGARPPGRRDRVDAHRQGRLRRQYAQPHDPAPSARAPSSTTRTSS